jgi:hypothetical protein
MYQLFHKIGLFQQSAKSPTPVVNCSDAKLKATHALKKTTVHSSQFFPDTPQDVQDCEPAFCGNEANNQSNPVEAADNPAMGAVNGQADPDERGLTGKEKRAMIEVRYHKF